MVLNSITTYFLSNIYDEVVYLKNKNKKEDFSWANSGIQNVIVEQTNVVPSELVKRKLVDRHYDILYMPAD